ncbi:DUF3135 domain-containing protein [Vibrio sp. D404a]|uniref:DUF3135 domain-containing protein n=2 Tax=Vibrio TaxID=662 RepID=UPI002557C637|nr:MULTISPECIES: DUF3135 domain-containing protein [unclassified Vibrio]MDK9739957.1 DUF3135 domain-containing protein [Vibrio sp. D404a]MDK9799420.1 DUF3135 domain-containing protein [Vibrio sp. D449a]
MGHPQPDLKLPPFDELVKLAQRDPKAFNQLKHDMCEQMICSASNIMQDRLRAQQSHIDLVVSRCKNPHHTNVVLMRELRCQVCKFQEALQGNGAISEPPTANVIPFKPKSVD